MKKTKTKDLLDKLKIKYQVEKYFTERYVFVIKGKMLMLTVMGDWQLSTIMSKKTTTMNFETIQELEKWLRSYCNGTF